MAAMVFVLHITKCLCAAVGYLAFVQLGSSCGTWTALQLTNPSESACIRTCHCGCSKSHLLPSCKRSVKIPLTSKASVFKYITSKLFLLFSPVFIILSQLFIPKITSRLKSCTHVFM